jgi:hypothetical protein
MRARPAIPANCARQAGQAALGSVRFVGEVHAGAASGVSVKLNPDRRRTELVEVS